jgi:hypothetical protein
MFVLRPRVLAIRRSISTLPGNPDVVRTLPLAPEIHRVLTYLYHPQFVHPLPNKTHLLTLLPTTPPTTRLGLGITISLPPIPSTFTENSAFFPTLSRILASHAADDPLVQNEALAFASPGGSVFSPQRRKKRDATGAGVGGGGVGGWLHVYDQRGTPPFGRIADPQDIFGSVLVDGDGKIVSGTWEENRTYRIVTSEGGVMKLSPYLAEKVREALKKEEAKENSGEYTQS